MNKKLKVAVLMGGKSSEHEVSIVSGKEVIKNLDKKKYMVYPLVISKDGKGLNKIVKINPDIAFIALHGKYGEDGKIQGFLEVIGIPYVGSGVLASAIGMDKEIFRELMNFHKVPIPEYVFLKKGEKYQSVYKTLGAPPYFVKPVEGGSSIGVSPAKNLKELKKSMNLAFKYDNRILVDKYIKGREFTCAVTGNDKPIALPVVEIKPLKGSFFDYESKYAESGSEEIVPARISKTLTEKIQKIALEVYRIVGCRGFGRVDFILKDGRTPVVLEVNTIPGLTPMSLFPKAAKAAGISYPRLLDMIIDLVKS